MGTTRTLADAALVAHHEEMEKRRAEWDRQAAEREEREERERNEAMEYARSAFVDRLGMDWEQADELVHLGHSRASGPGKKAIQHVVVAVPVDLLPPNAIALVVNWPNSANRAQIAVAESRGWGGWTTPSYGKRIETLADLGQLIKDRIDTHERNVGEPDGE